MLFWIAADVKWMKWNVWYLVVLALSVIVDGYIRVEDIGVQLVLFNRFELQWAE